MSLKIFLLGQFKLQANNLLIELPSRPAQSLLAYLALNAGVTHRREKLASLLWPDSNEVNARSYLRQALWRIRKALESSSLEAEDYLQISDISVTFDHRSHYWLDAEPFLQPVAAEPLDKIVEIVQHYRGELLPGFYDEWVLPERDRLEAAYHQKMNQLLDGLIQTGKWHEALKWGEAWIRLGHSPEPAFRALMIAYAGLGDQSMVSATYKRCGDSLDRELGLDPSVETRRLFEQILQGEFDGFISSPAPPAEPEARWPAFLDEEGQYPIETPLFVAREDELARLDRFLELALRGQGQVVFITGEIGSGKTALVNEFIRRAQAAYSNLIIVDGNCNAHTGIGDPYLPFREALELLTGDVESRWAAGTISSKHARLLWNIFPITAQTLVDIGPGLIDTFIPSISLMDRAKAHVPAGADWLIKLDELVNRKRSGSSIVPSTQQSNLLEQYTRVLQALTHQDPLMLVVDDLQWSDLGSINLLFHLSRNLRGNRILIVGAYRPEEVALGRDGERHPLESVVNEFQRQFGDIFVSLDQASNRGFIDAFLDSESNRLDLPFREMLYRQTRGHPLFTIELLRGMQERGDLVRNPEGQWVEGPNLDWETMPARVDAVIAERIGRLDPQLRTALRLASVEGQVFTAEVLARVGSLDERMILAQLSGELDRKHHLIRTQSIQRMGDQLISCYQFRHILFQKYLYSSLDEVERVHLHEQVGTALEELYQTPGRREMIAPQLARHFHEARIADKAIYYLQQAGDKAVQVSAYQEGMVHLTKGLALLMTQPDTPERAEQELAMQISLGIAGKGSGPDPVGEEALTRARQLCQQTGKLSELSQVLGELSIFPYVRAEYKKALKLVEDALDLAQRIKAPLLEADSHWHLGFILFGMGELTAAHGHLEQVISFYRPQQHHHDFVLLRGSDAGVSALAYDACCLWCLGYPEQAMKRSQEAITLARELEHAFSLADVLCYGGCVFNQMRQDAQALKDDADELARLSKGMGFSSFWGTGACYWGDALAKLGQVQEGIAQIHEGIIIRQSVMTRCFLSGILGSLAEAQREAEQIQEGLSTLAEALEFVQETDERYYEAELYRLKGELLLSKGNEIEAETSLLKALEIARQQSAKSWELRASIDLARFWHKQGRTTEAYELLTGIYNWFTEGLDTSDLVDANLLLDEMADHIQIN